MVFSLQAAKVEDTKDHFLGGRWCGGVHRENIKIDGWIWMEERPASGG